MLRGVAEGVDQDARPRYRPASKRTTTFFAGSGDLREVPPRWFVLLRSGKICRIVASAGSMAACRINSAQAVPLDMGTCGPPARQHGRVAGSERDRPSERIERSLVCSASATRAVNGISDLAMALGTERDLQPFARITRR